jgi:hypothetical protein
MSSKSRQQPPKHPHPPPTAGQPPVPARQGASGAEGEEVEPTEHDFRQAEELLKVPKGRSPLTYAFLIFLLIFLLVVFLAWDAFTAMGSNQGTNEVVMRWNHPTAGPVEVRRTEFLLAGRGLGFATGSRDVEEDQVARFLVTDRLARDSGVEVGSAELVEQLRQIADSLGGLERYKQIIGRQMPGGTSGFEDLVRDQLRIGRFTALLDQFAAFPDLGELERQWIARHEHVSFQATYATIADFTTVARAESPSDEVLQAWFDARPEFERRAFQQPARQRVELIGALFTDPERRFEALLAAYPPAGEVDGAAQAQDYYDRSYFARFRRAEPLAAEGESEVEDLNRRLYLPFEEAAERAAQEAAVEAALLAWRADVEARLAAGETVELAAEAERLGLDFVAPTEGRTLAELREMGGLGGLYIAGPLASLTTPGSLTGGVVIGNEGISVGRLLEALPATTPPVAEIREQVLDQWAAARAVELATAALEAVRATLAEGAAAEGAAPAAEDGAAPPPLVVSAEAFAAAVTAADLPLEQLDELDRGSQAPAAPSDLERFLRSRASVFTLEVGAVDAVTKSFDNQRVYLVRVAGKRAAEPAEMTASEFQQQLAQTRQFAGFMRQMRDPFSVERLREEFGLWLISDEFARDVPQDPQQP